MNSTKLYTLTAILAAAAISATEIDGPAKSAVQNFLIPAEFQKYKVEQITSKDFSSLRELKPRGLKLVDDPTSVDGKAMTVQPATPEESNKIHKSWFAMGIQGRTSKKLLASKVIKRADRPTDEKYHWFQVGKIKLEPNTIFFAHYWLIQQDLSQFYNANDPTQNNVTVMVSIKFTGPAYVKDSKLENGVYIDRFLILK